MAAPYYTKQKNTVTIKSIVLDTFKDIETLLSQELRGGFTNRKYNGNSFEDVYIPDTRKVYIQKIEFLIALLYPHFDDDINNKYTATKKQLTKLYAESKANSNFENYITEKLELMREMFFEINIFFKRTDYFQNDDTTEDEGEDV